MPHWLQTREEIPGSSTGIPLVYDGEAIPPGSQHIMETPHFSNDVGGNKIVSWHFEIHKNWLKNCSCTFTCTIPLHIFQNESVHKWRHFVMQFINRGIDLQNWYVDDQWHCRKEGLVPRGTRFQVDQGLRHVSWVKLLPDFSTSRNYSYERSEKIFCKSLYIWGLQILSVILESRT